MTPSDDIFYLVILAFSIVRLFLCDVRDQGLNYKNNLLKYLKDYL